MVNKSAVISGPTGSIGVALVKLLIDKNYRILLILRPLSPRNSIFEDIDNVDIVYSDVSKYSEISFPKTYNIFYHFAWDGGKDRDNLNLNIKSATDSMEAVRLAKRLKCKVFVGAGSQAECGIQKSPISVDTVCTPNNYFGVAKLLSMHLTRNLCSKLKMRHCWLRILSVYGSYDGEQTLVSSTILKLIKNEKLEFTSGLQDWDFLFNEDAAEIIEIIGADKHSCGVYVIGSGYSRKLKDFIEIITAKFGVASDKYLGLINTKTDSPVFLKADISRLKREYNWTPSTDFETGVEKTISYFKRTTDES